MAGLVVHNQLRALRNDTMLLTGGHALLTGGQWFSLVLVSHLAGGADLGRYALALAVASPVFLFSHLGLRTVLATDVEAERTPTGSYLRVRVLTLLGSSVFVGSLAFVLFDTLQRRMLLAVVALKVADGLSDLFYGSHQRDGRMLRIALSSSIRGVTLVATIFACLRSHMGVSGSVLTASLLWLGIALILDRPHLDGGSTTSAARIVRPRLFTVVALSLPLGLVASLDSLNSNLAKYFLEAFRDTLSVGQYTASLSVVLMGGVLLSGLGHAMLPRVARLHARGQHREVARMATVITVFVVLAGLIGTALSTLFGERVLVLLFGPALDGSGNLLAWLFGSATVWYAVTVWGFVLNGLRAFAPQVPLFGLTVLVSLATGAFLVPRFGPEGAAASFGISMCARAIGSYLIWRTMLREMNA